ncbi:MAG TPA: erythromycin esterase family protein [Vicinamibacterales bacterium]|nr:erythromycin esterase family protein [Vicinamibacterales bacterium]
MGPFRDRADAGRQLADRLTQYGRRSDVLVLALPRGGVPVAAEIARTLHAPLDVFLVRKLGVPSHPELAMGAIAEGGVKVLSSAIIRDLDIPAPLVEQVAVRERLELERRGTAFRGSRQPPAVADRIVILVDDGLATGASMEAAILALRSLKPARIVVAVPVGAAETCARIRTMADELVVISAPDDLRAVGLWYEDFDQTTDAEVVAALAQHARSSSPPAATQGGGTPADAVKRHAIPLLERPDDYDALLDLIGDARLVLIGEASHGTHEFYRHRALITRRLIQEKGFAAVAAEADWPDAYRVNRYVRHESEDATAVAALGDFRRFPSWMWRNVDVVDFADWLRSHNSRQTPQTRAGFYGLDLYSLHASMAAVLRYLAKADPAAAERARRHYACFDRFGEEPQEYAYAARLGMTPTCEREVVRELVDLRRHAADYARRDGRIAADEYFFAEQNARLVANAEEYYRTMLGDRIESWNRRDRHMAETLRELLRFLDRTGPPAKVVVWAHNSHLGDARATEMGHGGELNLGQLAREEFGAGAVLVGMTTHTGTVTAADDWDSPGQRKTVRPSLPASIERLFHDTGLSRFFLPLRTAPELAALFAAPRLERAIGVIYRPRTERQSHYFHTELAAQFDAVIHFDDTRAVEPLDRPSTWEAGELADTFPSGM